MECEPERMNASSFANNVSTIIVSFAVIVSLKSHQMRARQVSNASRYTYVYRGQGLTKQAISYRISDHYPLWAEFALG